MSLYILDTDHLSLFQDGHVKVCERAGAAPAGALAITVLSVEEQLSGWYTELRQAKSLERLAWAYRRLAENVRFLSRIQIVDFDEPAIRRYDELRRLKLKIRRTDLRIAAVVLQHQATIVTANLRDLSACAGSASKTGQSKANRMTAPAQQTCDATFTEGLVVRSTNPLYAGYGIGRIQKVKSDHAKVEFSPSVFMQPPYRTENKILRLAETERVDTPLERAARGQWEESWRFELKMLAARFLTGNKGGQLSNARTEILPHQIFAAHRVVSSLRRRFLLADEVGLGKAIEAGMIWQALYQRGQASAHSSSVRQA